MEHNDVIEIKGYSNVKKTTPSMNPNSSSNSYLEKFISNYFGGFDNFGECLRKIGFTENDTKEKDFLIISAKLYDNFDTFFKNRANLPKLYEADMNQGKPHKKILENYYELNAMSNEYIQSKIKK